MPMILIHKSMNNQILSLSSFPIASLHQTIHCCTYLQFHTLLNKLKSTSCTSLSIADRNITQIKPSVLTIKWIKDRLHFWGVMQVESVVLSFSLFKILFLLCNSLFCDCSQRFQLKLNS